MCDKQLDTFDESATLSDRTSDEDFFIDDYSHLRLSYYQHRGNVTSDDSNTTLNESKMDKNKIDDERRRLREYYVSQIPDLPHPSYTVASVIATASQKMNGNGFKYEKQIEQGTKRQDEDKVKFDPARRSTLKPNAML
ncbi:uncharacterized protein LOC124538526 [Vanessa cardui]|uniref:uncharacterized protein LOC124538526 n=1 Tax=Vanessa cardui TaxID=171605 RepID=UPI001F146F17|nr:uncharacterized protein LOC124538526 [Vanessa cardui]